MYERVWRKFNPPRPVVVDFGRALPLSFDGKRADEVPLVVRTLGLRLGGSMPGEQVAWIRLIDGQWLARVHVRAEIGRTTIMLEQWVPARAIRPPDHYAT
ncbi:hypothetical protein FOS14_19895 [Skermania sp. ID1734]|uniref:hypothetical protein n=1 Tax=Skermania sp. ID1734 TaxID=2597516 RepID=UPI00117E5542|nr:hypothetical protein [Skermania sp. ID1734]TSD94903.1 hypothetical protein FOS14_19895 [Skermania sp. ID1734]